MASLKLKLLKSNGHDTQLSLQFQETSAVMEAGRFA